MALTTLAVAAVQLGGSGNVVPPAPSASALTQVHAASTQASAAAPPLDGESWLNGLRAAPAGAPDGEARATNSDSIDDPEADRFDHARSSRSRPAAPLLPPDPPPAPAPAAPVWVRPDVGPLSSGFGYRWGALHAGIDLAGPYGSPIVAVGDGTVTFAGPSAGYGNLITVEHADGTVTAYGHMTTILVSAGPVSAGQEIALEGSEGHSTGPHLHFEVRQGGTPVDPIAWLAAHGVPL